MLTRDRRRKENCGENKFYFDLTLRVTKKSVVDQSYNEKNKLAFLFFVDCQDKIIANGIVFVP